MHLCYVLYVSYHVGQAQIRVTINVLTNVLMLMLIAWCLICNVSVKYSRVM